MPSTSAGAAVEAVDFRKAYGSEVALDGVSLSIPSGTVHGFPGPNGAGKTATMYVLTRLSQLTSGSVRICGLDASDRGELAPHVGCLPETPLLYDEFSAREQLDYVADLRDISSETAEARIDDLLDQSDLVGDTNKRIGTYSKGMKQKTAFIQGMLHDPDVLFLNELTSGLDPHAARQIQTSIGDVADSGTTVFLSTHILPMVEAVADEVGVLFDSRVVAEGTPDEVKSRAQTGDEGSLEDALLAVTNDEPQLSGAIDE